MPGLRNKPGAVDLFFVLFDEAVASKMCSPLKCCQLGGTYSLNDYSTMKRSGLSKAKAFCQYKKSLDKEKEFLICEPGKHSFVCPSAGH